jgi:dihydrolipoamide dehydrogenase
MGTGVSVDEPYDVVILGGGSGGYACAIRAGQLGLRVALIEKDKLGGTCLHRGCIPTKALLHAAETADAIHEAHQFGVTATFGGIDMAAVNKYKDGVVGRLYKGLQGLVKGPGLIYVEGEGRLTGPLTVTVGAEQYTGRNVVLASGSVARSLPGLDIGRRIMTSDQALELDWFPKTAVVLGGGVIGVEFASAWRSLGADVTIVEMLPLEDDSSAKTLQRMFRRRGISFELNTVFESVKHSDAGVTVSLAVGKTLDAELLLVAVGRGPVSAGLGYEENGVRLDRGFIVVDELCRTAVSTISAVGDLVTMTQQQGHPQLAHVSFAEGILVAERVICLDVHPIDYDGVPRITYSDPEVASVGLASAQVAERGLEIVEVDYPLGDNGSGARACCFRRSTLGHPRIAATSTRAPSVGSSKPCGAAAAAHGRRLKAVLAGHGTARVGRRGRLRAH